MAELLNPYQYPNEPSRFEPNNIDDLLLFGHQIGASDITIQTNEPIVAEMYGKTL